MTEGASHQGRRTVVITGGGSGIGRATARLFADEGALVLIVGRTRDALEETAQGRPGIRTLVADVADADAPQKIVDAALGEFGRIDVLVNNAGITRPAVLGEIDREQAVQQIETNLLGPIFLAQAALPHLNPGSVIVNVTSNPAGRGWPANSVYGGTKVALDFLTRTWAREIAARGVRVVSVAPGVTETSALAKSGLSDEVLSAKCDYQRIPLGRAAQPEEIAWWIHTVCGTEAGYLTGAVLRVDGGVSVC
ncbi:NAD(P)-dependent dehydrogenase (short-subunit alcohol dehydrogenase family) [Streptacidiphilus sp. EB129]